MTRQRQPVLQLSGMIILMAQLCRSTGILPGVAAILLLPGAVGAGANPWRLYDRTHGLAGSAVQAIARDGDGGLVIGTDRGLSRFDGASWTTWKAVDGMPGDDVRGVAVDPGGRIWVPRAQASGVSRAAAGAASGAPRARPGGKFAVAAAADGSIWLGHAAGMLRFDAAAAGLAVVPALDGTIVNAVLADREGRVWVRRRRRPAAARRRRWATVGARRPPAGRRAGPRPGRRGARLVRHRERSFVLRRRRLAPGRAAAQDAREGRRRWPWTGKAGSGSGPRPAPATTTATIGSGSTRGPASRRTKCSRSSPTANGSIWVGTARGLARFDATWSVPPASLRDGPAPRAPVLRAKDGTVWTAAEKGLLANRGRASEAIGPREKLDARVLAIAEAGPENSGSGPSRGLVQGFRRRSRGVLPAEAREDLRRDRARGPARRESVVCRPAAGLMGHEVTALAPDGEGGLWVGTATGLSRLCPAASGPASTISRARRRAAPSARWPSLPRAALGGDRRRPLRVRREHLDPPGPRRGACPARRPAPSSSPATGSCGSAPTAASPGAKGRRGSSPARARDSSGTGSSRCTRTPRGRIWVGTTDGVSFIEGGLWGSFGERDGLPSPRVTSIAEVDGGIWLAAEEGIAIHRPDRVPPGTRVKNPPVGPLTAALHSFDIAGADLETPPARAALLLAPRRRTLVGLVAGVPRDPRRSRQRPPRLRGPQPGPGAQRRPDAGPRRVRGQHRPLRRRGARRLLRPGARRPLAVLRDRPGVGAPPRSGG